MRSSQNMPYFAGARGDPSFESHGGKLKMSCKKAAGVLFCLREARASQLLARVSKRGHLSQQRLFSTSYPVMSNGPPAKMACVEQVPVLKCKKLSESAIIPTRGSVDAAGYDLYSAYDVTIPAQGKALVKTDLAVALPEGCYGRVAPRSGLAWKHHLDCGAGVIDRDYRGNVGVILFNLAQSEYQVKAGDRVAQLVLERIMTPPVEEVEDLDDTSRGAGGFGSTGRN